jgi:hypothetical protein
MTREGRKGCTTGSSGWQTSDQRRLANIEEGLPASLLLDFEPNLGYCCNDALVIRWLWKQARSVFRRRVSKLRLIKTLVEPWVALSAYHHQEQRLAQNGLGDRTAKGNGRRFVHEANDRGGRTTW